MAQLNSPRLVDVKVSDSSGRAEWLSYSDWLTDGDELCALTRLDGDQRLPDSVVITGSLGGHAFQKEFALADVAKNADYLPRQWAKQKIDRLTEQGDAYKDEIIELSKQMYVMSPYTSLIVLENEQMYEQYKVDRGRKDHWALYSCPQKIEVVHEPLQAAPATDGADKPGVAAHKTVRDVLDSILVYETRTNVSVASPLKWLAQHQSTSGGWMLPPDRSIDLDVLLEEAQTGRIMFGVGVNGNAGLVGNVVVDQRNFELANSVVARVGGDADLGSGSFPATGFALLPFIGAGNDPGFDRLSIDRLIASGVNYLLSHRGHFAYDSYYSDDDLRTGDMDDGHFEFFQGIDRDENSRVGDIDDVLHFTVRSARPDGYPTEQGISSVAVPAFGGFTPATGRIPMEYYYNGSFNFQSLSRDVIVRGTTLPSPYYLDDDIQYFTPGPEFPLSRANALLNVERSAIPFPGNPSIVYPSAEVWEELAQRRGRFSSIDLQQSGASVQNLRAYAPGLHTTAADVMAVVELELDKDRPVVHGKVTGRARKLIDKARRLGWRTLVSPTGSRQRISFDGSVRVDGVTADGLKQIVICDGTMLWHVYPEISLATKRIVSRYHRQSIQACLPWILPSVEDLSVGADVQLLDNDTVVIVPHGETSAKDPSNADSDRRPADRRLQTVLRFASDGRLAERHLKRLADGEVLMKVVYEPNGSITWLNSENKKIGELKIELADTEQPNLVPDAVEDLLVLRLPLRTIEHVVASNGLAIKDNDIRWARDVQWDDETATAAVASAALGGNVELAVRIMCYWFYDRNRDDWRTPLARFLPLLLESNGSYLSRIDLATQIGGHLRDATGRDLQLITSENAPSAGEYLKDLRKAGKWNVQRLWAETALAVNSDREIDLGGLDPKEQSFLYQAVQQRNLQMRIDQANNKIDVDNGKPLVYSDALVKDVIEFVQASLSRRSAWSLLRQIDRYDRDTSRHQRLADAYRTFREAPGVSYPARYQAAWHTFGAGKQNEAREQFETLHRDAVKDGIVPTFDDRFYRAFADTGQQIAWTDLIRESVDTLSERFGPVVRIEMARQCRKVGDIGLANELVHAALPSNAADNPNLLARGVQYYYASEQYELADRQLDRLLAIEGLAEEPRLWYAGARIAQQRGRLTEAALRHAKAVRLIPSTIDGKIDVEAVRRQFSPLMNRFSSAATALAAPDATPPSRFIDALVGAADRWRSMETDVTDACQRTAAILATLGMHDMAWDYLTTPLAGRGVEATAWVELGRALGKQDSLKLAIRAFDTAYEMEPTNAEILWEHAQMLVGNGRFDAAQPLFQKIVAGQWQPRFEHFKREAAEQLRKN